MQTQFSGTNIEAMSVFVYPQYFLITANQKTTGITSQIKIERQTRNIIQLGSSLPTQTLKNICLPTPSNELSAQV